MITKVSLIDAMNQNGSATKTTVLTLVTVTPPPTAAAHVNSSQYMNNNLNKELNSTTQYQYQPSTR